jgi:hypothetical protein
MDRHKHVGAKKGRGKERKRKGRRNKKEGKTNQNKCVNILYI